VADRFSKRSVIVTMKGLEILLMTLATLAVFSGHIGTMIAVLLSKERTAHSSPPPRKAFSHRCCPMPTRRAPMA
jgi:hypothetical protein